MKALYLANEIEKMNMGLRESLHIFVPQLDQAAAELRRLAAVNAELLEAASGLVNNYDDWKKRNRFGGPEIPQMSAARKAIAKATEEAK